jgi:hypothetical protein
MFGEALGPLGRMLIVVLPAIIAVAAAIWMLQSAFTLGGALIALGATGLAVGAMVANLSSYGDALGLGNKISSTSTTTPTSYFTAEQMQTIQQAGLTVPGLKDGGYVTSPTLAVVGEKAPEIVSPESKMREIFTQTRNSGGLVINVEGSVDKTTAEYIYQKVRRITQ